MSRLFILFLLVVLGAQVAGPAQASTYDLALTASYGGVGGTGSLTIDAAIPTTGLDVVTAVSGLTGLSFVIEGNTFTLSNDPGAYVTFNNGSLVNIAYGAELGFYTLDLSTAGLSYSYLDTGDGITSGGSILATPLPGTVLLFASGLLAFGFIQYRRGSFRNMSEQLA